MTDKAHKLVDKMRELAKTNATHAPLRELEVTACFAELQVMLAEESAKSAKKMERFTIWLIVLSVILTVFTAYLCIKTYQAHKQPHLSNQEAH